VGRGKGVATAATGRRLKVVRRGVDKRTSRRHETKSPTQSAGFPCAPGVDTTVIGFGGALSLIN
jgi:hypothetical protein